MSLHKLAHVFIIIHNQHHRFAGSRSGLATASPAFENLAQLEFHLSADFPQQQFLLPSPFIRLLYHSIHLVERQGYDKGRSLTYCRFYFNHTMMSLNEILHDVETDSGSRLLSRA